MGVLLAVMAWAVLQAGPARAASGRFESEIAAFEAADRLRPPPSGAVLFVGSSSIRLWPDLAGAFPDWPVLNRGFGGSEMDDLLHYFDRVVTAYVPSRIVVYEGDNDLASGKTPATVAASYQEFLDRVAEVLPGAEVLLLAVKPSPSRIALLDAQRQLNAALRSLADNTRIRFVDVFTPMLGADGQPRRSLYQADALHLSPGGYDLWESIVGDALRSGAGPVAESVLVDFGSESTATQLEAVPHDPVRHWNNLTTALGTTPGAVLGNLASARGRPTGISLRILRRFNAANSSGTLQAAAYPGRATQDSLFGNGGTFAGLTDVRPAFELSGLAPGRPHTLVFHASRLFTTDRRETLFRASGAQTVAGVLEPANNIEDVLVLPDILPDPTGAIRVELEPGPGNDSANRFIHLGVMEVRFVVDASAPAVLGVAHQGPDTFRIRIHGAPGVPYVVESSTRLGTWTAVGSGVLDAGYADLDRPVSEGGAFFRVRTGVPLP